MIRRYDSWLLPLKLAFKALMEKSKDTSIEVKTSHKICGGTKPTDWVTMKQQWNHLEDIPFPHLAEKGVIDVLLRLHYYHLFPMQEIQGQEDKPAARLCPFGWAAFRRIGNPTHPRGPLSARWCTHYDRVALWMGNFQDAGLNVQGS